MGREANVKKDRTCSICEDIRLRTAKEMREHYERCLEQFVLEQRFKVAGLVTP